MPQREEGEVESGEVDEDEEIVHTNGTESRLAKLEAAQGNNQAREVLTQLMSDPDIQAVYKAKTSGKRIKVVDDVEDEVVEPDPTEEAVKGMAEDDPQRQLITTVSKLNDAKTEKAVGQLLAKIEALEAQVAENAEVATTVKRDKVTAAVVEARGKFKDFDQFKEKMVEISKENPGLGVEDLYYVAKARTGKLRQVETIVESEKPTSQPRRVSKPGTPPKRPAGRAGFHEMLSESFARTTIEGIDQL